LKEHHPEARKEKVEAPPGKKPGGGIAENERGVRAHRAALFRASEHRGGYVYADDVPGRPDETRECQRAIATSATHIGDVLTGSHVCSIERRLSKGTQEAVETFLLARPPFSSRPIPISDLVHLAIGKVSAIASLSRGLLHVASGRPMSTVLLDAFACTRV
jgi:hypothetical protein